MIFNKPAQCKHCGEAIIKGTGTDECWIDRGLSRFCGFSGQQHEPAEPAAAPQELCFRCNQQVATRRCHQCDAPLCDHVCEEWHLEKDCEPAAPADSTPQSGNGEYCNCPGDFTDGLPFCQQCGLKARVKPEAKSTRPEPLSAVTLETTTAVSLSIDDYNQLLEDSSIVYDALKAIYDLTGIELNEVRESLINKDRPFHKGIPVNMPEDTGWLVELAHSKSMSLGDLIRSFVYEKISSLNPAAPRTQGSESLQEWRDSVSAVIKTIPEFHGGEWAGDKEGWGFHFEVVRWLQRKREELEKQFAAQPQPAPRPPACLWCEQGNKPVHRLQDGRWIEPCTAIPAQKEEK